MSGCEKVSTLALNTSTLPLFYSAKVYKSKSQKPKALFDRQLLFLTIILTIVGIVFLADASAPLALNNFGDKYYFAKQQIVWGIVGIISFFIVAKIKYTFWKKIALPLFLITLTFLILVLIPAFGGSILGAKRWIFLGPINFQPAEFVKLSLIIYFALLTEKGKTLKSFLVPLGIVSLLVMLEPDLGTTISILLIGFAQIFVSGVNLIHLGLVGFMTFLMSLGLILTSSYRKTRLLTYLEHTSDPLGASYHIRQILFALGSGGIIGVGFGQSRQKYLFLPESATDSIFAVIAEEMGFIGAAIIIFAFIYLILRGLKIASTAPDTFSKSVAVGVIAWIGGQAFLNIASMVALVPLTGIPLPFFSYGGSSLIAVFFASGILLNISRYGEKG